jgi:hypothetical protein
MNFVVTATAILLVGCTSPQTIVRTETLRRPASPTCIEVSSDLEARVKRQGIRDFYFITRLARGPYVAELEDAEGTYYRAPPGGLYLTTEDAEKKPVLQITNYNDGGIWIPRASGNSSHIYMYISNQGAAYVPTPSNTSCATAFSVSDPKIQGLNTVAFAVDGAVGGAIGGAIAKVASKGGSMSFGQAVGTGAVGGAVGGLIVAELANMDVGKITHFPMTGDPAFVTLLDALSSKIVPIPELPAEVDAGVRKP